MNFYDKVLLSNMKKFEKFGRVLESKKDNKYSPDERYGVAFICMLLRYSSLSLPDLTSLFSSINCITDYGSKSCLLEISEDLFTEKIVKKVTVDDCRTGRFDWLNEYTVVQVVMDLLLVVLAIGLGSTFSNIFPEVLARFVISIIVGFILGHAVSIVIEDKLSSDIVAKYKSVVNNHTSIAKTITDKKWGSKRKVKKLVKKINSDVGINGYYSAVAELELMYMCAIDNCKSCEE